MEVTAVRKGGNDTTQLAAGKRFGKYKGEEEKEVRTADVKQNPVIESLKEAWKSHNWDLWMGLQEDAEGYFRFISGMTEGIDYSSDDIADFSIALIEFQEEHMFGVKAGFFLSALIDNCKDSDYTVYTKHLDEPVEYLGIKNRKNITVEGDVSHYTGHEMQGGSITVKGNAGHYPGRKMTGGSIVVEGGAKEYVGRKMTGGTITVKGNAGSSVGASMFGGEIHLDGNYGSIPEPYIKAGKIYHKGELIVDK